MKKFLSVLCALALIVSGIVFPVKTNVAAANKGYLSVGYLPNWSASGFYKKINWDALTHICLAFCNPNTQGELSYSSDSLTRNIVTEAHNHGVKVLASLGGADYGDNYAGLVTSSRMASFNDQIITFAKKYNLDGVDIDIEGDSHTAQSVWNNYETWIAGLSAKCKENNLMFTTAIGQWYADRVSNKTLTFFDYVMLMEYDCNANGYTSRINYFTNTKKVPANKLVLGVGFYGGSSYTGYSSMNASDKASTKSRVDSVVPLSKNYAGIMNWELTLDTTDNTSLMKSIQNLLYDGGVAPRDGDSSDIENPGDIVTHNWGDYFTTAAPTTTQAPTTKAPTTKAPTTVAPTTKAPTTVAPTTKENVTTPEDYPGDIVTHKWGELFDETTQAPTTKAPTTAAPTTKAPTTVAPTTAKPTTQAPTTKTNTTTEENPGDIVTHKWGEVFDETTLEPTTQVIETTKRYDSTLQAPFGLIYAGNKDLPYYFAWGALTGMDGFNVYVDGQFYKMVSGFSVNIESEIMAGSDSHVIAVQSVKGDRVSDFTAIVFNTKTNEVKATVVNEYNQPETTVVDETTTVETTTTQEPTTKEVTTVAPTTKATTTAATTAAATTSEPTTVVATKAEVTTVAPTKVVEVTNKVVADAETTAKTVKTPETQTEDLGSADEVEQKIISAKTDKDPDGSTFGKLRAKAKKSTKKTISIKWNRVNGAVKYIIYSARCGKNIKKLKVTTKLKFTHKKLKKGKYYKYLIVAVDKNNKVLAISKMIHEATKGGKVCNAKKVKVNKKSLNLVVGGTAKLKAKQIKESKRLKIKNHRKMYFESTNEAVATVTKNGVVKAVGKGSCEILVYAQNGIFKSVKVTAK